MNILEEIKNDKLIQKYLCKQTWISGSSTEVAPITIWKNKNNSIREIILQIDTDKNVFNRLIERYKSKYSDIDYIYFDKTDNSCPSQLVFKMTRD